MQIDEWNARYAIYLLFVFSVTVCTVHATAGAAALHLYYKCQFNWLLYERTSDRVGDAPSSMLNIHLMK